MRARDRQIRPNLVERHSRACRSVTTSRGRCDCAPKYRVSKMVDGKRISRTVATLRDAENLLREWDLRSKKGLVLQHDRPFSDYLADFRRLLEQGGGTTADGSPYKPRSRQAYLENLNVISRFDLPELNKPVDAISRHDMQRVADTLGVGVKKATQSARLAPLERVWLQVSQDLEMRNPMERLRRIKDEATPDERPTPTVLEAYDLISRLSGRERMATSFCLFLGCRISEALALRWSHLDVDARIVRISGNWSNGVYTTPKTGKGIREVGMPDVLVREIQAYREWLLAQPNSDLFLADDALVVSNKADPYGRHLDQAMYARIDRSLGPDKGRLLRGHALRRALSSTNVKQNTPISVLGAVMGHTDPQTTLKHYSSVGREDLVAAAGVMDDALGVFANWLPVDEARDEAWQRYDDAIAAENRDRLANAEVYGGGWTPVDTPSADYL